MTVGVDDEREKVTDQECTGDAPPLRFEAGRTYHIDSS